MCLECLGVSTLFSCVSRIWWRVRLIFWYDQIVALLSVVSSFFLGVQNVAVLLSCFLVCPECGRVRLVFWCVQTFAVCPLCFLVCSDFLNVSSLFSGLSRMWRCVRYAQSVAVLAPCFLVSGMLRRVRLVSWCFQNIAVFQSCFLVCLECRGVYALFPGVQNTTVCPPWFVVCQVFRCFRALFYGVSRVQTFARCPLCFLVLPVCSGLFAFVFWFIQTVASCPPCSLVCPDYRGSSAYLSKLPLCVNLVHGCFQVPFVQHFLSYLQIASMSAVSLIPALAEGFTLAKDD